MKNTHTKKKKEMRLGEVESDGHRKESTRAQGGEGTSAEQFFYFPLPLGRAKSHLPAL